MSSATLPRKSPSVLHRIRRAATDERLISVPTTWVIRAYKLSHADAMTAKGMVRKSLKLRKSLSEAKARHKLDRLVESVREFEQNYPGICRAIVTEQNNSEVARKYNVTRQHVHKIAARLDQLADAMGKTPLAVAVHAAKQTLPVTVRDEFRAAFPGVLDSAA